MYKGDVTPAEAYERLTADGRSFLVDCRTVPEWNFVGVPVVERFLPVEWQNFPSMQINAGFVQAVEDAGVAKDVEVFVICRSGVRSVAAAQALTAHGYESAYNVLEGFEGDKNENGQRGKLGGWKHAGLPWQQG